MKNAHVRTCARARKQKYIYIYISLHMKTFLKTAVYIYICILILGSLSNDDGDSSENSKRLIGVDWQNNNFARAAHHLYISLPSLHDYDVKFPSFTFFEERGHKRTAFFFFS